MINIMKIVENILEISGTMIQYGTCVQLVLSYLFYVLLVSFFLSNATVCVSYFNNFLFLFCFIGYLFMVNFYRYGSFFFLRLIIIFSCFCFYSFCFLYLDVGSTRTETAIDKHVSNHHQPLSSNVQNIVLKMQLNIIHYSVGYIRGVKSNYHIGGPPKFQSMSSARIMCQIMWNTG